MKKMTRTILAVLFVFMCLFTTVYATSTVYADSTEQSTNETLKGEKPCLEFLNTLEVKLRAKAFRDMALLEEKGTELRLPYSEHLDDGIFELRTKQGRNIIRNLYFFFVGNKIIITHGFRKKTQKVPSGEIERAKEYRKDYLARNSQKEEKK